VDEIRHKLAPLVGKRIKIRGTLQAFREWINYQGAIHRDVGRALISQPELDGEVLSHHVWVMGVQHWLMFKDEVGKQVEFSAVVKTYTDKHKDQNYHLINPDELVVLHGPPALTIPDPVPEDDIPIPTKEDKPVDKPVEDPLEILRQVKTFVKAVGGQEAAGKVAEALGAVTIPVAQLIAWIKALGE
jgi:hypothetical protein